MDAQQIALVQNSFAQLTPLTGVADLFYARLFQLDPSLRPLFKGDLSVQKQALTAMLEFAVANLAHPNVLRLAIDALNRQDSAFHVQEQQYDTVVTAWLWTLEQTLGEEFTPEIKAAWAAFYQGLAQAIQEVQGPVV